MHLDRMRESVHVVRVCVSVYSTKVYAQLPVGRICCVITEERARDRNKIES